MDAKTIAKLEAALVSDPSDVEARAVYADALIEMGDDTRGELIVLTKRIEDGDPSDEVADRVRELETVTRAMIGQALPKNAFALCRFRHGMIDRIELSGAAALKIGSAQGRDALSKFFQRPELSLLRGVDFRRAWPEQRGKSQSLFLALPKMLSPKTTEWIGVGPAVDGRAELDLLAKGFPKLRGMALFVDHALPVLDALHANPPEQLVDLEFCGEDLEESHVFEKLLDLSKALPNLERLVIFAEDYDLEIDELDPILNGELFPKITSFGIMINEGEFNEGFLNRLLKKKKLLSRLTTSLGIACDGLETEVEEWLQKHAKDIAHIKEIFTAPGAVFTWQPEWDDARDDLAMALYTIDRNDEALRLRTDLVIANPKEARYWDNLGDSLRELEHHEEALVAFEKAIAIDRNVDTAWSGKADSLSDLDREKEALVAWNRAVKLDPRDAYTQNGRAITLANLGSHDEALKGYAKAIKIDGAFIPPYSNRGDVLLTLQRFDEALSAFEIVVNTKDNEDADVLRANALNRMGLIHQLKGDRANAKKCFEQAIKTADDDDEPETAMHPRTNLARLLVKEGQHRAAFKIWDFLYKSRGVDSYDRLQRAWVHLELGDAKEALTAFEKDCELSGSAFERLVVLEALGRQKEALAALEGHAMRPMTGCLYRWVSESLLHAILLLDSEENAKTRKRALARARATPHEPQKHFDALKKRAEKEGGTPLCNMVGCVSGSALIAVLAALLEGNEEEAHARGQALIEHLCSVELTNELGLKWGVSRLARLAKIDTSFPFVTSLIDVAEVMIAPASLRTTKRTKKARAR